MVFQHQFRLCDPAVALPLSSSFRDWTRQTIPDPEILRLLRADDQIKREVSQPMLQFRLHLDYSLLSLCEPLLGESGAHIIEQAFTDRVIVDLLLPHSAFDTLRQKITAISSGKAIFDINESSI